MNENLAVLDSNFGIVVAAAAPALVAVACPTLSVFGTGDGYLGSGLAGPDVAYVTADRRI